MTHMLSFMWLKFPTISFFLTKLYVTYTRREIRQNLSYSVQTSLSRPLIGFFSRDHTASGQILHQGSHGTTQPPARYYTRVFTGPHSLRPDITPGLSRDHTASGQILHQGFHGTTQPPARYYTRVFTGPHSFRPDITPGFSRDRSRIRWISMDQVVQEADFDETR